MSELPRQLRGQVPARSRRYTRYLLNSNFCFVYRTPVLRMPAAAQTTPQQTVAIIYRRPTDYQAKGYIHALFVENLLGHFGLAGEIIPSGKYQPGMLQRYHAGFYIGVTPGATRSRGAASPTSGPISSRSPGWGSTSRAWSTRPKAGASSVSPGRNTTATSASPA